MSPLWQQLQALRIPPDIKSERGQELHHHITQNVLPFLNQLPTKLLALGDEKPQQDPLQYLHPSSDTLPYLYILLAQITITVNNAKGQFLPESLHPDGDLWNKFMYFMSNFDEAEIRYARSKWSESMELFDYVTSYGKKTAPVLRHMADAILRLDPSNGTFTTTHLLFLRLCLRTRSFVDAQFLLDRGGSSFPQQDYPEGILPCAKNIASSAFITAKSQLSGKLSTESALEYHLLGAMVYIGLHDWTNASYQLEHVLMAPTHHVAHAFMLEAYKKWTLVQLLLNGKLSTSMRSVNAAALKAMRSTSKPYDAIVEAFKEEDSRKLCAEIHDAQKIYQDDGNMGLVRHVLDRHRELSLIRLGNVYAAVPLNLIESTLHISRADIPTYVQDLINTKRLNAEIEQPSDTTTDAVLKFSRGSRSQLMSTSEDEMRMDLAQQRAKISALAQEVSEADRRLSLAKEYLAHVARTKKNTDPNSGSPEHDAMDMSFGPTVASDEDESIMEL